MVAVVHMHMHIPETLFDYLAASSNAYQHAILLEKGLDKSITCIVHCTNLRKIQNLILCYPLHKCYLLCHGYVKYYY